MSRQRGVHAPIALETIVPGGVLPTDKWHVGTNDGTCSRCGAQTLDGDEVPLMLWSNDGHDMLIFCGRCLTVPPAANTP